MNLSRFASSVATALLAHTCRHRHQNCLKSRNLTEFKNAFPATQHVYIAMYIPSPPVPLPISAAPVAAATTFASPPADGATSLRSAPDAQRHRLAALQPETPPRLNQLCRPVKGACSLGLRSRTPCYHLLPMIARQNRVDTQTVQFATTRPWTSLQQSPGRAPAIALLQRGRATDLRVCARL